MKLQSHKFYQSKAADLLLERVQGEEQALFMRAGVVVLMFTCVSVCAHVFLLPVRLIILRVLGVFRGCVIVKNVYLLLALYSAVPISLYRDPLWVFRCVYVPLRLSVFPPLITSVIATSYLSLIHRSNKWPILDPCLRIAGPCPPKDLPYYLRNLLVEGGKSLPRRWLLHRYC